jgi:transcriptional regulator with XRE-family HTH domain
MLLGERIKRRREQLGISQQSMAESLKTSQNQIYRYEKGTNSPTAQVIIDIARILEVSTDWLLGISDIEPIKDESDLHPDERKMLALYRSIPPQKRERLLKVVSDSVSLAQG